MLPWLNEPDRWVDLQDFCRIFNYSYRAEAVNRRLIRTGALADFGMKTCCVIIPGKANFRQQVKWYIRLAD
jgi:hypothetical protein